MPKKILVVDDEDIIRESLSYTLKNENYEVDEAANGKEAYNKLKEASYDLVITDIEMPEMKGTELLKEISAMNLQTSSIVITAYGSLETAITALRTGASDYILKPVEFDELLIKVKRLFEVRELLLENRILRKELQREYGQVSYKTTAGESRDGDTAAGIGDCAGDGDEGPRAHAQPSAVEPAKALGRECAVDLQ